MTAVDERARRVAVTIDADAWVEREAARREALQACNRLRLADWRLQRTVRGDGQR